MRHDSASASLNILNAHFKAIQGVVDAAKSKMRETGQGVPDDEGDDDDDDDEGTEYDEDGNKVESSEGGEDASEETVESGLVAPAVWGEAEAVAELVKVPEEGYKKPEATAAVSSCMRTLPQKSLLSLSFSAACSLA